jgi:HEAT repeat protein
MARQQPDFSFERDGRPLGAWLRGLAGEDATARRAAGEALQAMLYGVPSVHTDLADIEWGSAQAISEHGERFKAAIRAAVETPGFDARGFVHELILYRMALRDDWHRRMAAARDEDDAPNTCRDRLLQRLESADGDGERSEALRRYLRWVCANMARSLNRGRNAYTGAESIAAPGFMSSFVFDSLDELLLADRPGLHAMLADEDLRRDAARALARIGPPAVDFASVFFEELDAEETARYFGYEGAPALGSIGRDDAVVIDGLLRRLRSGSLDVRAGAAAALEHAGPPLAGRLEIALDLLLGAT